MGSASALHGHRATSYPVLTC
ncbi:hypothetical protein CCACVL1_28728 [Corchorus capsularis]|uniref:Uncharacterized protein n=1 Tax=Corchorus capsularis TaxID=210143 RepID=A0A1R3G5G1_COCAP|nr:hypothetical protein CCACVL1_28728 [Corchorus capsularis]